MRGECVALSEYACFRVLIAGIVLSVVIGVGLAVFFVLFGSDLGDCIVNNCG